MKNKNFFACTQQRAYDSHTYTKIKVSCNNRNIFFSISQLKTAKKSTHKRNNKVLYSEEGKVKQKKSCIFIWNQCNTHSFTRSLASRTAIGWAFLCIYSLVWQKIRIKSIAIYNFARQIYKMWIVDRYFHMFSVLFKIGKPAIRSMEIKKKRMKTKSQNIVLDSSFLPRFCWIRVYFLITIYFNQEMYFNSLTYKMMCYKKNGVRAKKTNYTYEYEHILQRMEIFQYTYVFVVHYTVHTCRWWTAAQLSVLLSLAYFFFHYEMVKLLSIEHAPAAADGFGCFCAFLLAFFSGFVHFCPAVLLNYSKLTKKRIRQNVK